MQVQHNNAFTVSESDTIDSVETSDLIFRVSGANSSQTSVAGESAYLSFQPNETKTIAIPLGYSTDDRCRFIAEVSGTLQVTVTHPTFGAQIIILKDGSTILSMRISSISCLELLGSIASIRWSLFQISNTDPEAFS